MSRSIFAFSLLLILLRPTIHAQQTSLPGCEAPPAIRKTIKDQLHSPEFDRLPYAAQFQRKQQVLSKLIERYPREVEPYNLWIAAAREDQLLHPELLADVQKEYRDRAAAHPDDSLALYLAGAALQSTETPESIRLLERAQSLSSAFAWPPLQLAQIYSSGKFADKAKFTNQLTKFWTACPTSQNQQARWMLVKNPELQAKVVSALRPMLAKTTDRERLKDYEFLWGLEFRTSSPKGFPQVRHQVAADVKRLESIKNPHPDADWLSLLLHGDQQAEASPATIRAREDAIITRYPHSGNAQNIVWARWQKEHPKPTDEKDTAAWNAYHAAYWSATQEWLQQYPDSYHPNGYYRFALLPNDVSLTERQGTAMAAQSISDANSYFPPSMRMYGYFNAAYNLLDRDWDPGQALDYLQNAKQWQDRTDAQYRAGRPLRS